VTVIQSILVVLLGLALGASFTGGIGGVAVLIAASVLLVAAFGALSCALALVARQEETLIGAVQFVVFPLTFLSSGLMPSGLMPGWVEDVARYNPVNWAIEAGREALGESVGWTLVLSRSGALLAFAIACSWLATRAFRSYQRSI
jgi:ABC-2 type transport system permease protein